MVEVIRSIRIRIEIDTNKDTYRIETDDMDMAIEWYNDHMADM